MATSLSENYERIDWNRAHRAPALEDMFGWQRTPDAELPDPGPLVRNIALGAVESIAGLREPEQLRQWLMPHVFHQLLRKHVFANRRHTCASGRVARSTFRLLSCRTMRVSNGVVEAAAVVGNGYRARAVALRLDAIDHRWRVTELHVL